jgi:hypothetical protein
MKECLQPSKKKKKRSERFFLWIIFSKTFRRILNDSQTPTPTPPTTIGKTKRKTVTIVTSSIGSTSTPSTPVEPAPSPINSIVLMRARSPDKSSPVVVVPRQTAEHCKQTSHITARPNSMI